MALSPQARQKMRFAFPNAGVEIADVIDSGSGTLSQRAKEVFIQTLGNRSLGLQIIGRIEAGTALDASMMNQLGLACADRAVALEIRDELAS